MSQVGDVVGLLIVVGKCGYTQLVLPDGIPLKYTEEVRL